MVSELILKIRKKYTLFVFVAFTLSAIFCGCDMRAGKYPFQIASEWRCEVPKISLVYPAHESNGTTKYETIEWQNEKIIVDIMFGLGDYCVYPVDSVAYKDRLFNGTWKYRNGNLILIIDEDFLFDDQFTELSFYSVGEK